MAQVILNKVDETKTEVLNLKAKHLNGVYRFCVSKETEVKRDGYTMTEWTPFAEGNFNYTIGTGRKSQKKLDTYNNVLETYKDKLYELWQQGNYNDMCLLVALKCK